MASCQQKEDKNMTSMTKKIFNDYVYCNGGNTRIYSL